MAKKSRIERNKRVKCTVAKYEKKRADLHKVVHDKTISMGERMQAQQKLAALPRDSSRTRVRNRCLVTGNPRGFHGYFGLARGTLRHFARKCMLPGVVKASL